MALSGVGYLKRVTDHVRLFTDEAGADVKFTDANLVDFVRRCWADVQADVNRVSAFKPRARISITVVSDQREYALPPNVANFLSMEKRNAVTDDYEGVEWAPNHPLSPSGPGFTIEGPMIRFDPVWRVGETVQFTYVPSAEIHPFEGTALAAGSTTTLAKTKTVVDGTKDARPHAYNGYVYRLLDSSGNVTEERQITAYDGTDPTVAPALADAPAEDEKFEVVPNHAYRFEHVVGLRVSRLIAALIGDADRAAMIQMEYREALRTVRLDLSQGEQRIGKQFYRRIRGRRRHLGKTR